MMRRIPLWLALVAVLALTACSGGAGGAASGAPKAVEDYLAAIVGQDTARVSTLTCADWEADALLELDSFQGVTARLDTPACAVTGEEGGASLVTCQGKIIATYNNEDQELSLAGRTYRVVQEGGEWRVCGYQE